MATKWFNEKKKVWYIKFKSNDGKWHMKYVGKKPVSEVELLRKKYDTMEFNRKHDLNAPIVGLSVESILDQFINQVLLNPVYSDNTHKNHNKHIKSIQDWMNTHNIRKMDQINNTFITTYNEYMLTIKKHKKTTAKECQKIFIRFLNWSIKNHYFNNYELILGIEKLKKPKKGPPRFFSTEELNQIFKNGTYPEVYQFLFYTGLRIDELCNLKWNDIIPNTNKLLILGPKSGADVEAIPLNSKALKILSTMNKNTEYMFLTTRGERLTQGALYKALKITLSECNIPDGSIHTFRHSFASHLAIAGVPIQKIKELMRHSDIKTTMIYAHLTDQSIEEASEMIPEIN